MIKEYIDYLKDNSEGYWFKAKLYGWGWIPATWQGWLVVLIYITGVLVLSFSVSEESSFRTVAILFIAPVAALTGLLIAVCYKKGEKPSWRWGLPKKDKTGE